jgi:hypothetical protein
MYCSSPSRVTIKALHESEGLFLCPACKLACVGVGRKKTHNAVSVEGCYRGQYQQTPRSARRTPRNPSHNRGSAEQPLHNT